MKNYKLRVIDGRTFDITATGRGNAVHQIEKLTGLKSEIIDDPIVLILAKKAVCLP